jgi:hypothetical protein
MFALAAWAEDKEHCEEYGRMLTAGRGIKALDLPHFSTTTCKGYYQAQSSPSSSRPLCSEWIHSRAIGQAALSRPKTFGLVQSPMPIRAPRPWSACRQSGLHAVVTLLLSHFMCDVVTLLLSHFLIQTPPKSVPEPRSEAYLRWAPWGRGTTTRRSR